MPLISDKKIVGLRHMTSLVDEDPLGQVKFVHLFKVTVLNLHVIMMKPETKLIILAARLCSSFKLSQLSYYEKL